MKKRNLAIFSSILILTLATLACSIPTKATPTAQIIVVTATSNQETVKEIATDTPSPTGTAVLPSETVASAPPVETTVAPPTETSSPTPTDTLTPLPCNRASFVTDVSVPDDTVFEVGTGFTKTWRLKNTGTCNWTSGYQLVFDHGDQMGGPASQQLTNDIVPPNGTVDISVNLVAPGSPGSYQGFWKIREPGGSVFALNTGAFWVKITTKETNPTLALPKITLVPVTLVPLPLKLPDLFVSEFTLTPANPVKGQPVHVRIGIYNKGNAAASSFKVVWYGLSTFSDPSCSWDIATTVNVNGGRILECDYVFQSWYPNNKTTVAIVDSDKQIFESDESNNKRIITPFGVSNP